MASNGFVLSVPVITPVGAAFHSSLLKFPNYDSIVQEKALDEKFQKKILSSKVCKALIEKNNPALEAFQTSLSQRVKPFHKPLKLFQLFRLFLHDQLKLYKAVVDSDQEDIPHIDQLLCDLADFRSNENTSIFASKIQPQLKKIQDALCITKLSEEQIASAEVWKAWEKILENPHLSEPTTGAFSKEMPPEVNARMNMHVEDLCRCYNLLAEMFCESFSSIIALIFKELENVKKDKDQYLQQYQSEFGAPFYCEVLDDVEKSFKILNELNTRTPAFMKHIYMGQDFNTTEKYCKQFKEIVTKLCGPLGDYHERIRYAKEQVEKGKLPNNKLVATQYSLELSKGMQKAHVLFDTFIADPISSMCTLIEILNTRRLAVKRFLRVNSVVNHQESLRHETSTRIDADRIAKQLMKESEASKSKKARKKQDKASKRGKNKRVAPQKESIEKGVASSSTFKPVIEMPTPSFAVETALSSKLLHKMATASRSEFFSLKNALYHLNSLNAAKQLVELTDFDPVHRLNLVTAVQSSGYYLMEQLLRSKMISENDNADLPKFHGLRRYLDLFPTTFKTRRVADRLFLACRWSRDFHDFWNRMTLTTVIGDSRPKALEEIIQVAMNSQSKDLVKFNGVIKKDVVDILGFCTEVLGDMGEAKSLPKDEGVVTCQQQIGTDALTSLKSLYQEIFDPLYLSEDNLLSRKLRQTSDKLDILISTVKLLDRTNNSQHFSMLVGRFAHLLNQVLEEQLKTICVLKKGVEPRVHFLDVLWEEAGLEQKIPDLFRNHFDNGSRTSRYPFEEGDPKNQLHRLLLAAIALHDNPETEEGFKVVGKNEGLPAEEIRHGLKVALQQALKISKRDLLPTIKSSLNADL